jgi:molybdopterin converting factor subunit 1
MVAVTVRYFAAFREQAGCDREQITTTHAEVGELFAELAARHGFADPRSRCKVAVNDELVTWNAHLSEGDNVLFFPPVAAG